jgi:Iodothyronine deiodinase
MLRAPRLSGRSRPARIPGLVLVALCAGAAGAGAVGVDQFLRWREPAQTWDPVQREAELAKAKSQAKEWSGRMPVGSPAPNFVLPAVSGEQMFHLADRIAKKPVVLVFGSFGCDLLCKDLGRLTQLCREYDDRAQFFFVSITEAPHPVLPAAPPGPVPESRAAYIRRGMEQFHLNMPCLVDGDDKAVEEAYHAYPRRLVIVDRKGRIALDTGKGVFSAWDLDEVAGWLKANLPAR